jgi:hypothetical protein
MLKVNDKIKIKNIGCARDGLIGEIEIIYPPGVFHSKTLYQVYFGNNQSGQFTKDQLIKLDETENKNDIVS